MNKRISTLLLLLSMLSSPFMARAEEIHIITNTMPPLKFKQSGVFQGVVIDLLVEVLRDMGHQGMRERIVEASWNRAYDETLTKPGTILSSMVKTANRADKFKWVGPVYRLHFGLIGRGDRHFEYTDMQHLSSYRIGTQEGTAPETELFNLGFPVDKAYRVRDQKICLKMLQENRIDLLAHATEPSLYAMGQFGMNSSDYRVFWFYKRVEVYFGLNNSFSDEFVNKMQKTLDALKQPGSDGVSRYDRIVSRYITTP